MDSVEITIQYPTYSVAASLGSAATLSLIVSGHGSIDLLQPLARKQYSTRLATVSLFGASYGVTLSAFFMLYRRAKRYPALADLTAPFRVDYGADAAGSTADAAFQGLFFHKELTPAWFHPDADVTTTTTRAGAADPALSTTANLVSTTATHTVPPGTTTGSAPAHQPTCRHDAPLRASHHWPDAIAPPPTSSQIQSPWQPASPVFQRLTEAALASSLAQPQLLHGVVWPDDPMALLFLDRPEQAENDFVFSNDLRYRAAFALPASPRNLQGRAFTGDLQCLHAMAAGAAEDPATSAAHISAWLETMYKLAIAQASVTADTSISATAIAPFFGPSSWPTVSHTLGFLLRGGASSPFYAHIDLRCRALGVCLRLVQASYARGHVQRTLLNPQGLLGPPAAGPPKLKAGTWGQYGQVERFLTNAGATLTDPLNYAEFDGSDAMKATNVTTFDGTYGARDAIEKSAGLLGFAGAATPWEGGVKAWVEGEVFKVGFASGSGSMSGP